MLATCPQSSTTASAKPEIQALVNEGESLAYRYTGFIALLFALYGLLAIPFRSLIQNPSSSSSPFPSASSAPSSVT